MGPVSHTVQLTVLGINGITVSSCAPGRLHGAIGTTGGENGGALPVSAFVSFSRNKTAVTTLPSKPLGASPEGIELDMTDSDDDDSDDEDESSGRRNSKGMRHVALWGFSDESTSQGCSLKLQVKLHKKGLSFERKEVDVTVGLVHDEETFVLAASMLNITGPVPSMQFDLPLRRVVDGGATEGIERRHKFGGRGGTPRSGTPRAENFGVGVISASNDSHSSHHPPGEGGRLRPLGRFNSDKSRGYGLDRDATVRVMVSVITTREYNERSREAEAARGIVIQQMAMAQANHLGQPVIVKNFSTDSPVSSISHTAFSSSGDAAESVMSRSSRGSRRTQQSRRSSPHSSQRSSSSRRSSEARSSSRKSSSESRQSRSNSRSKSGSERNREQHHNNNREHSRERSAHLPPRGASGRPPQPTNHQSPIPPSSNPNPHPTSPRQALQLTPFSPTLTQTGRVPKVGSNTKPPRPSPPVHIMSSTPEKQGKTPPRKKMDFVDGSLFSPISMSGKEGGGGQGGGIGGGLGGVGRFSPSRISISTPKTPKGFKLKKVFKALTPRTGGSSSNSVSSIPNTPAPAGDYDLKTPSPMLAGSNAYAAAHSSSPATDGLEHTNADPAVPTLISGNVGSTSFSSSTLRGSRSNANESCTTEYVSLKSRMSVDSSFKSHSHGGGGPLPPQAGDLVSEAASLEINSKQERITVETSSTFLSEDDDSQHEEGDVHHVQDENNMPTTSLGGAANHYIHYAKGNNRGGEPPNPATTNAGGAGGAGAGPPQFSNKKLEELGISASKEQSLYDKLVSGFFCRDEINAAKCVNVNEKSSAESSSASAAGLPPKFVLTKMNSDASIDELTLTTFEQRANGSYNNLVPAACGGGGVCATRQSSRQHIGLPEVVEDEEDYGGDHHLHHHHGHTRSVRSGKSSRSRKLLAAEKSKKQTTTSGGRSEAGGGGRQRLPTPHYNAREGRSASNSRGGSVSSRRTTHTDHSARQRQRSSSRSTRSSKSKMMMVAQVQTESNDDHSVGDETMESIEAAKKTLQKHADKLGGVGGVGGAGGGATRYSAMRSEHGEATTVKDDRDLWNPFDNVCRTSGSQLGGGHNKEDDDRSDDDDESCSADSSSSGSTGGSDDCSSGGDDSSTLFDDEDMTSTRHRGRNNSKNDVVSTKRLIMSTRNRNTPPHGSRTRTQGVSRRYRQRETAQ